MHALKYCNISVFVTHRGHVQIPARIDPSVSVQFHRMDHNALQPHEQ